MNIDDLCMGCLSIKGAETICPSCGYQERVEENSGYFLSPRTVLNQNRYLLGRVLGHGGFGVTYLAMDLNLNIKLAIKEYLPNGFVARDGATKRVSVYSGEKQAAYNDGLRRFMEEAKMLAKLSTIPGIVTVRDYFEENNTAYLVMYFLEGMTFKEFLEKNNDVIPYETALTILLPAMKALSEVHKHQIYHRDISPDNIYITKDRQVKLLDFGAARQVLGEQSKSLSVVLKEGYAPEEQYRSRGKQGPWTDVYAMAATFFRAITGRIPTPSLDRVSEDHDAYLDIYDPDAAALNSKGIPEHIYFAIWKAMSVRAVNRYQSMDEFYHALVRTYNEGSGGDSNNSTLNGNTGGTSGNQGPKPGNTTPPKTPSGCLTLGVTVLGLCVGGIYLLGLIFS